MTRHVGNRWPWWRWLFLLPLAAGLSGCGGDKASKPADGPVNTLVILRQDGTAVPIPTNARMFVWCGPWEAGEVEVPSLHIVVGVSSAEEPGWRLRAVLGGIHTGDSLSFPNTFVWDQPQGVEVFLLDPPNELSTATDGASGWIVFHRLPCPTGDMVEFTIDAVLGSEFGDGPPASMRGRFVARTTGAPPRLLE